MATTIPVSGTSLLTVKSVQTKTQEARVLESFLSSLLPNDLLDILDANPNLPTPRQSKKTGIPVYRDDVLLPQITADLKIHLPRQPVTSREKSHRSTVLKLMLSLKGILHFK